MTTRIKRFAHDNASLVANPGVIAFIFSLPPRFSSTSNYVTVAEDAKSRRMKGGMGALFGSRCRNLSIDILVG